MPGFAFRRGTSSCLAKKKYPRRRRAHCVARLRRGLCAAQPQRGLRNSGLRPSDSPRPFSVASCAARRRRGQEGKPICDQPPTVSIPFGVLCLPLVERRATEWGRATVWARLFFAFFWRPKRKNARASGAEPSGRKQTKPEESAQPSSNRAKSLPDQLSDFRRAAGDRHSPHGFPPQRFEQGRQAR